MDKPLDSTHVPNPKRVTAGKRNRALRRGLTPDGVRRLRETALVHKPWQHSTGPRTATGKRRVAANGCWRQKGELSRRQLQAELATVYRLARDLAETRELFGQSSSTVLRDSAPAK